MDNTKKIDSKPTTTTKRKKVKQPKVSYINVNRTSKKYRDKYKKDVEDAVKEFSHKLGKQNEDGSDFTDAEWRMFFKTVLIPLDKDSEKRMISLFLNDRPELNNLLILHNTKASDNLAEVYFKKYEKECPNKWYDQDDFYQLAREGLAIAADRFDPALGNKFITFATWWMLNRVRKPYNDKGAMNKFSSMDAPQTTSDGEEGATFGEMLSPDDLANGWVSPMLDSNANPLDSLEREDNEDVWRLYSNIMKFKPMAKMEGDDEVGGQNPTPEDRVKDMADYLISILEGSSDNYKKRQIFLYIFKKMFNKCAMMLPNGESTGKLNTYMAEAAKSKSELLKRLEMDETQYKEMCKRLTRGTYGAA